MRLHEALGLPADHQTPEPLDPVRAAKFCLNEIPKWVNRDKLDLEAVAAMLRVRPQVDGKRWRTVLSFYLEQARR